MQSMDVDPKIIQGYAARWELEKEPMMRDVVELVREKGERKREHGSRGQLPAFMVGDFCIGGSGPKNGKDVLACADVD